MRNKIVVVAGVALAAVVASVGAVSWAPGAEAQAGRNVGALDRLPAVAAAPEVVRKWAGNVASRHGDADAASQLKLLRAATGTTRAAVYAFKRPGGGVCAYRVRDVGSCTNAKHLERTGIQWMIGGGTDVTPNNFFAIVTDDVAEVTVDIDGSRFDPVISNNVSFIEIPRGDRAAIKVTYRDGHSETANVQLRVDFSDIKIAKSPQ